MEPIPVVGEFYHFWDDGKSSIGRHYIAKVEGIISLDESKEIIFIKEDDYGDIIISSLYDIWKSEKEHLDFLFAQETDYFIKCSIPKYDKDFCYFTRTKYGGWFSMKTTCWWQGGKLDVTGEKYKSIIEDLKNDKKYDNRELIEAYESQTY